MPVQLPPDLLAPYVATAADEVREGRGLSDRSLWALADAIDQLEDARDAAGRAGRRGRRAHVSLIASSTDDGVPFAALVLGADLERKQASSPQEHERNASASLDRFVGDLEKLTDEDQEAARRLQPSLERIIDQLLSDDSD